jgi:hypothetical protein
MSLSDEAGNWARRFGLASASMFERESVPAPGCHSVLLDGAYGAFAISLSEVELWRDHGPANWAWSSDIPHHVTVTPTKVGVLRWDQPGKPRVFDRDSIARNLDGFYHFLTADRLRSNRSVIDHLLGFFRRLRSLGHAAGLPDARATDLFTACLARLLTRGEPRARASHALGCAWPRGSRSGNRAGLRQYLFPTPVSLARHPSCRRAALPGSPFRAAAGCDRIRPVRHRWCT